jgi:hypothetical protein
MVSALLRSPASSLALSGTGSGGSTPLRFTMLGHGQADIADAVEVFDQRGTSTGLVTSRRIEFGGLG